MDGLTTVPWVFAQTALGPLGGGAGGAPSATPGTGSLLERSLWRWFASLTLSPPSIQAGEVPEGIWAVLGGLGALFLVALAVQGPRRALGQLVDVPGHLLLWSAATARVRRSSRLLIVVVGVAVVSWTGAQGLRYTDQPSRSDLALLLKDRRVIDVAWAQGALAALTPLRDMVGLSLLMPMLLGATFVLFQYSTFRWSALRPAPEIRGRVTFWATVGWGSTALSAMHRFVGLVAGGFGDRPIGGCLGVGALGIPILMALADGVLVAWVLVELRHGGGRTVEGGSPVRADGTWDSGGGTDDDHLDVTGVVLALPAAVVGCLLTFPARYIATGVVLGSDYLPPAVLADLRTPAFLRWELSWGLVAWQAVGLALAGWLGAAAWDRGGRWSTVQGFGRLLARDGARVVVVLLAGAVAAGVGSALAYATILSLPGAPWVLAAADSYAHYVTIPVGLITLAALVELGGRSAVAPPSLSKPIMTDWAEEIGGAPGSGFGSLDTKRGAGL